MGKLFGTDGVRGVANLELTPELAFKIGEAAADILLEEYDNSENKNYIRQGYKGLW